MATCTRQNNKHNKNQPRTVDLNVCALCLGSEDNVEQYGKFFRCSTQKLAAHEYCLFFASGLAQNGEDHEGFDGFLFKDIVEEIKRASRLRCTLCRLKGAAIGCNIVKCGSAFHFKCGLQKDALFQFFGSFCAFCRKHRPTQNTLRPHPEPLEQAPLCPICLSDVVCSDVCHSLKSPCCKNAWFHKHCIQKQALANGMYFFRCAFCNNYDEFQKEMRRMGIYIPDRDAIWEQGDAYVDLLHQHNSCDTETCLCPKGREFSGRHKGDRWKIYRCYACGQSGTHRKCQGRTRMPTRWFCQNCITCFPQDKDAIICTPSESEPMSTDDSQSTTDVSQTSEIPLQEFSSPSTDTEDNIPLSNLLLYCKTKKNVEALDNVGSTSKESSEYSNSLNDDTTVDSFDDSSEVDVDGNISTDSSLILNHDSKPSKSLNNKSIVTCKPKGKKRKLVKNGYKTFKLTKAKRKAIKERYAQKRLSEEQAETQQLENFQNEMLNNCIGKKDAPGKNANDSFYLLLSPESDSQEVDLRTNSPNGQIHTFGLAEGNTDTPHKPSLNESLSELACVKSDKESPGKSSKSEDPFSLSGTTHSLNNETTVIGEIESPFLESEFNVNVTPTSNQSSQSKHSDCSETSSTCSMKKLLQRDIRGMLIPKKEKTSTSEKSPVKVVDDKGCQTSPTRKRRAVKRRKLSTSTSFSESRAITTFMTAHDSSPKRKVQANQSCSFNGISPLNDEIATSTVSSSFLETMTVAKGLVMRALRRLSGPSEPCGDNVSTFVPCTVPKKALLEDEDSDCSDSIISGPCEPRKENDSPFPLTVAKKALLEDTDSDCSDSIMSGPCENSRENDCRSSSAPFTVAEKALKEDTDSDSSDSVKVVKVKKGRGTCTNRYIPLFARKCNSPSAAHEKHCECYKAEIFKVASIQTRSRKHLKAADIDPSDVIVIDDESDEQDSGKGSSRETSDAGMKSGYGSEADKGILCTDDGCDTHLDLCYSSCEDEISFDNINNDKVNTPKKTENLDSILDCGGAVDDCHSRPNGSNVRKVGRVIQDSEGCGEKAAKKCRTNRKKKVKDDKMLHPRYSIQTNSTSTIPSVLFQEELENSYFSDNFLEGCVVGENPLAFVESEVEENSETNIKGDYRKKEKWLSKKIVIGGPDELSPSTQKAKLKLQDNRKIKALNGRKKLVSLKTYTESSDEDFQTKKKIFTSKAKKYMKDIKTTCVAGNKEGKKKLRKKRQEKEQVEPLNVSSSATVSTMSNVLPCNNDKASV